ncbi:MAG: IS3 family transposase, partial [Roseinatronobacter sp.]
DQINRGLSSGRAANVLQIRRRIHGRNRNNASITRKALAPREPSIHGPSDNGERGSERAAGKKLLTPAHRRAAVKTLMEEYQFTERRACRLVGISRSSLTYQARPDRHARLRERLITLSGKHRRYGYRMLHAKLVRENFRVNVKVVERIYRED